MARDPSTYRANRKKVARDVHVPWVAFEQKMYGKKRDGTIAKLIERPAQPHGKMYGRSPAMDALPALRKWNELSPEERSDAVAALKMKELDGDGTKA